MSARHIASVIEDSRKKFCVVVESSITPDHDFEVTEHGFGLDISQNGLTVHVDHSQFKALRQMLREVGS